MDDPLSTDEPRRRDAPEGQAVRSHWDYDSDEYPEDSFESQADGAEIEGTVALPAAAPLASGRDFVHLHAHSEFSLLDGLSAIPQMVSEVKRHGMRSLALTDHGNLYGAIEFYQAAKGAGIKPILGVEAYVSPRGMTEKSGATDRNYFHLVLLARNRLGYQNLLRLVTRANLEGYYYKPRIDRALLAEHSDGLLALSGCFNGEPSRALIEGDPRRAREAASWYRDIFGEHYFLELQNHGIPNDQVVNSGLLEIHREMGIPVVATNDTHYATASQADAQDLLLCVQTNSTVDDPKRMRMQPGAFYLKSADEMWSLLGEVPAALNNTLAIAERCDLSFEFGRLNFPPLDHLVPKGELPQEFLARTCRARLQLRYGARLTATHQQRLDYELGVIQTTGFAQYILFVWDFVDWARKRGITCGPRGSAAGSIILYSLGISDVDPIGYGLTFERFLNPERSEMPDIDMDFADDRRDEVIQYVVDRYGQDRVAQIITFGRLQARAAIRDVGRALGYQISDVDRVAKLISPIPIGLKIDQAMGQNPELKRLYDSDAQVARLIDGAKSVEGVARHAGTHAAGIVVADQPLVNYVPLQKASRGDSVMTQYPQKALDKIGLLKMDFLGLANLTMLARALENIRAVRHLDIDFGCIDLTDRKTYEMLGRGETRTVFQLEGSGMTRYIQDLKPSTVDHLAAMVALYRPGPMAQIPSYIARRDGREAPAPPHPALEDVLRESYGIVVYQDQVLQVVRKIAGYSLGQADVLRKAMGKKIKAVMEEEGPKFLAAAAQHGYTPQTAEHIWELLQPFAGYAFNKAHAYCYAFLAYQTAYLKANFPVEWFSAVLSTIGADSDRTVGVVGECRRLGVSVLPPDINRSCADFTVEQVPGSSTVPNLGIRFGLCAVKNVGEGTVNLIVGERERGGPYRDLDDFCRRLDLHTINKRVLESLIKCGSTDAFGAREVLLKVVDAAIAGAQRDQKAASTGQVSLFDGFGASPSSPAASPSAHLAQSVPASSPRDRAAWEKEVLGFNFADHPFMAASARLAGRITHTTSALSAETANEKVIVAGAITSVRKIFTRNKSAMAVATLEDLHGSVEVVAFPRQFEKQPDVWREDAIILVEGKVDVRDERVQVVVDRFEEWTGQAGDELLSSARAPSISGRANRSGATAGYPATSPANGASGETRTAPPGRVQATKDLLSMEVVLPRVGDDEACIRLLQQLQNLLHRHPGDSQVRLLVPDRDGGLVELCEAPISVTHSEEVVSQVRTLVGGANVRVAER